MYKAVATRSVFPTPTDAGEFWVVAIAPPIPPVTDQNAKFAVWETLPSTHENRRRRPVRLKRVTRKHRALLRRHDVDHGAPMATLAP